MFERYKVTDWVLNGLIFCIGAAEAVHLVCLFGGRTVGFGSSLFMVLAAFCVLLTVVASLFAGKRRTEAKRRTGFGDRTEKLLLAAFLCLVLLQLLFPLLQGSRCLDGDMTVETVVSFLQTDGIYRVNPMTGAAYSVGLPMRIKVLGLPSLYTFLCRTFGCAPDVFVWYIVPAAVCLFTYCGFAGLAHGLFPEDRKRRLLFLVLVSLLIFCGSYRFGMDGFGLLFCGWRAVTIRNLILLPYTLSLCLRKRYPETVLCVLAEACITWTFYGLGMCAAMTVLFFAVDCARSHFERRRREC